jgi:hypothetical protein
MPAHRNQGPDGDFYGTTYGGGTTNVKLTDEHCQTRIVQRGVNAKMPGIL